MTKTRADSPPANSSIRRATGVVVPPPTATIVTFGSSVGSAPRASASNVVSMATSLADPKPRRNDFCLRQIEQQRLARFATPQGERVIRGHGGAVSSHHRLAIERNAAPDHLQPRVPTAGRCALYYLAGLQQSPKQVGILVNC